ncbi:MAG: DUF2183 domain-containing protein [Candidatus Riflebacteria bacterium]|nr:DUF2183 domain-containing protein [Candidatus Riflebacteria bacterium]
MKKLLSLIILFVIGLVVNAYATKEVPRVLYKTFLPVSEDKVILIGKMILVDCDKVNDSLSHKYVKNFFENRLRNFKFNVRIGRHSQSAITDDYGDFEIVLRGEIARSLEPNNSVVFDSPEAPEFRENASFQLPKAPERLIISDVDDTVLVSDIPNKKNMIRNTFFTHLTERKEVKGTPQIYQRLINSSVNGSSLLLFLSGSPTYFGERLSNFFKLKGFPENSLILRHFGPKEQLVDRFLRSDSWKDQSDIKEYKITKINQILQWYKNTKIILIGDSGELDPEVYQKICELFPGQQQAVIIHDVTNQDIENPRYAQLRKLAPLFVWSDPEKLTSALTAAKIFQ